MSSIKFIDESCVVGDNVMWKSISNKLYKGKLLEWKGYTAIIKRSDGEIVEIDC